jgi:hypothetical protein
MNNKKTSYDYAIEFEHSFENEQDDKIVDYFNKEVGKNTWGIARTGYILALSNTFSKRGIDYSIVGNWKSISLAKRVRLVGKHLHYAA